MLRRTANWFTMGLLAGLTLVATASNASADDWGRRSGYGYQGRYVSPLNNYYAARNYGAYYRGGAFGGRVPAYGNYYGNGYGAGYNLNYNQNYYGNGYRNSGYYPEIPGMTYPRPIFNPIYGRALPW